MFEYYTRFKEAEKKQEKHASANESKDKKSDAKPINDDKRRHSLGPDLLWEEID